ncbi:hypothetical protein AVEN_57906-1 [Araneus ventricosus]|uniref:Uncharacterized protein n=1 Tax=Araneus ventricosus TaxID=182803 RepID=A0A4Y2KIL3_ARAVE|nr:hypothetical protein AVEN_57906-1 [Araneus ventricosus]
MPLHVSIEDIEDEIFNGIRELQTCDLLYLLLSRHEKTERTKQLMDTFKVVAANINDGTRQFSPTANNDIVPHPKRSGIKFHFCCTARGKCSPLGISKKQVSSYSPQGNAGSEQQIKPSRGQAN